MNPETAAPSATTSLSLSSNRRAFLKLSGLLAAGLVFTPAWAGASATGPVPAAFSPVGPGRLAPMLLQERLAWLATGSTFWPASLKHCLTGNLQRVVTGNTFFMGASMPYERKALLKALEKQLPAWREGKQDKGASEKMALLMGALTHQLITAQLSVPAGLSPPEQAEASLYQAAALIRAYLGKGQAMGAEEAAHLHALFMEMMPRTFTRFHTLMPDEATGPDWVLRVQTWRHQSHEGFRQLAQAIAFPDSRKHRRYVSEVGFLDESDAILKRLSLFKRTSMVDRQDAENLLADLNEASHCAQALGAGYQFLIALGDHLSGVAEVKALREAALG